ncbi:MAG: hypothetical protein UHM85_10330, partial [Acutalibacteraceae bacterium]|nr:hypothetical protein [Acutalibacteraceae bacterium]
GTCNAEKTWNEVTYCSDCNAKLSTEAKTGEKDSANHVGGTYTKDEDIVAGTCNAEKTWNEVTYCAGCDAKLSTEAKTGEKDPANHASDKTYNEGYVAPTCTTEGATGDEKYECCDAVKTESEVIPVDADAHTGTANVIKNKADATCTADGYTGDIHWSCCDALETEGTVIPELGHDMQKTADKVEATCEEAGKEAVYTCANGCGKTEGGEEIEALGHSWSDWTYISGSCAEGEVVFGRECANCDAEETDERISSNVGHTIPKDAEGEALYDTYSAPNCVRDGLYTFTCAICETKEIRITAAEDPSLKAYGHKWVVSDKTDSEGWIVTSEPTCFRSGAKYRVCANGCGTLGGLDVNNREIVIIPATNHAGTLISVPAKAATCTENGYTAHYYCTECGTDHGKNVIMATGHKDENNDGKCDGCKTPVGASRDCGCICHKQHWFMRFIYKIVRFFWKLFKIGKVCDCGFVHY